MTLQPVLALAWNPAVGIPLLIVGVVVLALIWLFGQPKKEQGRRRAPGGQGAQGGERREPTLGEPGDEDGLSFSATDRALDEEAPPQQGELDVGLREELERLGATLAGERNPSLSRSKLAGQAASIVDAQAMVSEITQGAMADKAILAVGLATGDLIAPMMSLVKKAGRGVVTAVANMMADDVKLNLFEMSMMRKELVGCIFGNANPRYDIPRLLDLYMDGKLKLDEMVTTEYSLDEINQGYQDMRDGKNIRGVIRYE